MTWIELDGYKLDLECGFSEIVKLVFCYAGKGIGLSEYARLRSQTWPSEGLVWGPEHEFRIIKDSFDRVRDPNPALASVLASGDPTAPTVLYRQVSEHTVYMILQVEPYNLLFEKTLEKWQFLAFFSAMLHKDQESWGCDLSQATIRYLKSREQEMVGDIAESSYWRRYDNLSDSNEKSEPDSKVANDDEYYSLYDKVETAAKGDDGDDEDVGAKSPVQEHIHAILASTKKLALAHGIPMERLRQILDQV